MNLRNTLLTSATALALLLSASAPQSMPAADRSNMEDTAPSEDATMDTMDDQPMDEKEMETDTMAESDEMESHEDNTAMEDESMETSDEMESHDNDASMDGEDMENADEMESHEDNTAMEDESMETSDEMESHEDDASMEGEDMENADEMASHDDDMMMGDHFITLDIAGLENLGEGYAYEGWLIVDGSPLSTGLFAVDTSGMLGSSDFPINAEAVNATAFVLTIEPSPDSDPAPSAVHLLGGDLMDGMAQLSIAHPAALGNDFAAAGGTYIIGIGAPATAGTANTYRNGIWFDKLNLPQLAQGWLYEGWVVGPDGPITTGKFAGPSAMDQDGSGPYAGGPGTGPAFPGQDYLNPPLDLTTGYAAVISIEPHPDNSQAPFTLKPLADTENRGCRRPRLPDSDSKWRILPNRNPNNQR